MKQLIVQPANALKGTLEVPGDKSISHRAIIMGSLVLWKDEGGAFPYVGRLHLDYQHF